MMTPPHLILHIPYLPFPSEYSSLPLKVPLSLHPPHLTLLTESFSSSDADPSPDFFASD